MKRRGNGYIIESADGREIGETWRYINSPSKWGLSMTGIYWNRGEPNRYGGCIDKACASRQHAIDLATAIDAGLIVPLDQKAALAQMAR